MQRMKGIPTIARSAMLIALLLAGAVAIPQQAPVRYTVEIVVFRTASQVGALPADPIPAAADDEVEIATSVSRRLGSAANKLKATAGYRVLAHTSWSQTPVSCSGAECRNVSNGASATRLGLARAGVAGRIALKRGRVLNLGIDLTVDDGGRRYHISEVRQIEPGKAQYFDHPSVGVLAVVNAGG
jgi:hypothetical protein